MNFNTELHPNEERRKFVEDLKKRVHIAYTNRVITKLSKDKKVVAELLEEDRRHAKLLKKPEKYVIEMPEKIEPEDNQVFVENSHDYPLLLQLAYQELKYDGYFEDVDIPKEIRGSLEHEYQHHVPALGVPGLKMVYSVFFIEEQDTGKRGLYPTVSIYGEMNVKTFREIMMGPIERSKSDRVILGRDGKLA